MSSTLYWEPAKRPKVALPDELKRAIRRRWNTATMTVGAESLEFLKGLEAADIVGATELIRAIGKHRQVCLKEEF